MPAYAKQKRNTHATLAATAFDPVPGLSELGPELHARRLEELTAIGRVAIQLLALSKPKLIASIQNLDDSDIGAEMLSTFQRGKELAEVLVRLIGAAELRFGVALANVIEPAGMH